jgi:L-threonylcarbamoyladenylate synthase
MSVQEALRAGEPACFPTETLWALAAKPASAAKIFALKERPEGIPLAVGFASWADAKEYVHATPIAEALAAKFLPGPISLVCHRKDGRLAMAAPDRDTISVRVPNHPIALEMLTEGPLLMTSANKHGEKDPILASEISLDLPIIGDSVPGIASTVVDCTSDLPTILREGAISSFDVHQTFSKGS